MSATRAPGESFEAIVRANAFMTLATADAAGRPWASPVWFATDDCLQFIWASKPHARHSTNLALRPEISIAIFDSGQPPGTGLGVYMTARAELVPRTDFESALAIYSAVAQDQGLPAWTAEALEAPARHRLYRATAVERFVLSSRDERIPVPTP